MSSPVPPPSNEQVLQAVGRLVGDLFGPDWLGATCEVIPADALPPVGKKLLVHTDHMTKVLEAHFGYPVNLRILVDRQDPEVYRRAIVLTYGPEERVAEFGTVRIELSEFAPEVRDEILGRKAPLGDILIRHDVLRRVEPRAYLRFHSNSPVLSYFRKPGLGEAWGRWGTLHANGTPSIELLEIVSTEDNS